MIAPFIQKKRRVFITFLFFGYIEYDIYTHTSVVETFLCYILTTFTTPLLFGFDV